MREETDEMQRLLRSAREGLSPSAGAEAAVRSALVAKLGAPLPVASPTPLGSFRPLRLLQSSGGLVAVVGLVAAGFWGGYQVGRAHPEAPPLPQPLPRMQAVSAPLGPPRVAPLVSPLAPQPVAPAASEKLPVPAALPVQALKPRASAGSQTAARRSARAKAPPQVVPPEPGASLQAELALLKRAERAIRRGDGLVALALLDSLGNELTPLQEERDALETLAHCQVKTPGSVQRGKQFRQRFPRSVYLRRVREACAEKAAAGE